MKVTIEFTCPRCGLWTPGFAEIPDDAHPRQKVQLENECLHCDETMLVTARVADLRANPDFFRPKT